MRILAIDFGLKRLGIAVSDPLGITAQPLLSLQRGSAREDIERLREIASEYGVSLIVIGMPKNMDGSPGALSEEVERFLSRLRDALGLPVETWDERLTTAEAERMLIEADLSRRRRRQVIDKIAASLILQSYLASRCNPRSEN